MREIAEIVWIAGNLNPADYLTMTVRHKSILERIVEINSFVPKHKELDISWF